MERKAYLFWLAVSNHIHNINVSQRAHGQTTDIFRKINVEGEIISHLTANKESV